MGFFSRVVFAGLYDCLMNRRHWDAHRRAQLETAGGEILEVGAGTGLNLPHYPDDVRRLTVVEPNPGMNRRLQARALRCGIAVEVHGLRAEALPFGAGRFDTVACTLTLCSITDVDAALAEIYRVLRPGGRLLFLEHGLSPDPGVRRWQRRLSGLQRRLADGCRLDRDIRALVARQPFVDLEIENFAMERTPRIHGFMYRGRARK